MRKTKSHPRAQRAGVCWPPSLTGNPREGRRLWGQGRRDCGGQCPAGRWRVNRPL